MQLLDSLLNEYDIDPYWTARGIPGGYCPLRAEGLTPPPMELCCREAASSDDTAVPVIAGPITPWVVENRADGSGE
jgi:hypothetical protein